MRPLFSFRWKGWYGDDLEALEHFTGWRQFNWIRNLTRIMSQIFLLSTLVSFFSQYDPFTAVG